MGKKRRLIKKNNKFSNKFSTHPIVVKLSKTTAEEKVEITNNSTDTANNTEQTTLTKGNNMSNKRNQHKAELLKQQEAAGLAEQARIAAEVEEAAGTKAQKQSKTKTTVEKKAGYHTEKAKKKNNCQENNQNSQSI